MAGTIVGHYELLEKLGEGGMGVVYRARDTVLNRYVALKFLPQDAAFDDDRKRRFLQEAQVASALNHPNIVTVYEVNLDPPQEYIAMEYVQGRPLDALIGPDGTSSYREALGYSVQIAGALAAAHNAGIVHRDIKPGNVIISDSGVAKVLDFGLAKLVEAPPAAPDDATRTVALRSSPRTVQGAIIGTVAFMSPEQAEGKPVDHRSDIFSFGAMLYEMLTGKRAFTGDSAVSTLAAVLRAQPPDPSELSPGIPRELSQIVRRCLEKSTERRWQSMADVRALLEDLREDPPSAAAAQGAVPLAAKQESRWVLWALAGVAAAGLALAGYLWWRPRPLESTAQLFSFRRMTSDSASNVAPTISPDGRLLAYASDRARSGTTDIWVQQVAGGEAVRLTSDLGLCHSPSFSPDGSRIVFHGGPDSRGIYVVSTFGGAPRRVADGRGPVFSPDGSQISYMSGLSTKIMVAPAVGGTPREITTKHNVINRAVWLPDGKRLLFLGSGNEGGRQTLDWYSISVEGGEEASCGASGWLKDLFQGAVPFSVTTTDVLLSSGQLDNANIYRVPFDGTRARVTGSPIPVTMAPGVNFWPAATTDGTKVVFGNASSYNTNLWMLSIDAEHGKVTGEPKALSEGLVDHAAPSPSEGGKRLAYKATWGGSQEIRVLDVAAGQETRIAETIGATPPLLSTDGAQIAYAVREKEQVSVYVVPATGGVPRRVCTGCGRPVAWFDRSSRLLYDQVARNTEIAVLDIQTGKSTTILRAAGARIYTPRVSPDGKVLSFTMVRDAERRTYVVPFSTDRLIPEQEWKRVTEGAGADEREPFWSPDGRFLYFLSERDGYRCIWNVRFDAALMKGSGAPNAVEHFHQFRRSLLDFGDVADIGLSLAGKSMFVAVRDIQSNIWLAERKAAGPNAR